jgi:hypothetical protein
MPGGGGFLPHPHADLGPFSIDCLIGILNRLGARIEANERIR